MRLKLEINKIFSVDKYSNYVYTYIMNNYCSQWPSSNKVIKMFIKNTLENSLFYQNKCSTPFFLRIHHSIKKFYQHNVT